MRNKCPTCGSTAFVRTLSVNFDDFDEKCRVWQCCLGCRCEWSRIFDKGRTVITVPPYKQDK